ncbi:uncharacterized protein K489DRAFT_379993 [Dissoconium aciculare CBS 342.82]|uniref:Chromatin assembly factor 1 subunit A n=1 Tax=Dissoconium aciculare CBS 342.82 TaxID=1314786 RepID=A0A6J3M403_9PEZI|nr:uncharacterized protein K489DRAFT_379993 [Dissoconium aciculare CBS 342.82]KAF1822628.1 hypothetical protein K489DRAFT_379993 [Dissoconium aciculare CBS 342.82]
MDEIESAPATPNPRKRAADGELSPDRKPLNLKGTQFMMPTPPVSDGSSNASAGSSAAHDDPTRAASPAPSCSTLTSMDGLSSTHAPEETATGATATTTTRATSSGAPPAKRRKLTPSEKLEKQRLKDLKDKERAEEKAKKEEERARKDEERVRKDEEKRMKDLEKQKKAEEREAKKREKDLEEERRAQEKLKKERSQMRLGAFFQSKPAASNSTTDNNDAPTISARRKSLSLEPFDAMADKIRQSVSPAKSTPFRARPVADAKSPMIKSTTTISDYSKTFLPFVLPSYSTLAITHKQPLGEDSAEVKDFDRDVVYFSKSAAGQETSLRRHFHDEARSQRGLRLPSVRALAEMIDRDSSQVVDLTKDAATVNPYHLLQTVPIKHIHFCEDVRPAYCGTYTKIESSKVSRAPFSRVRPDTDYDYDSECEWEEPEEGDDIVSEDEDDADSDCDGDEIDGFLDDSEDALKNKSRMITGDLVPDNTGLCWQNPKGRFDDREQESKMRGMRLENLLPVLSGKPIDPFSTQYWEVEVAVPSVETPAITAGQATLTGGMLAPPRPPLQPRASGNAGLDRPLVGAAQGEKGPITSLDSGANAKRSRKPQPKTLSKEDLEEFKDAVVGSTLGKLDLLKGLKTRFPKMTHDVIKETLGHCFAQVGTSKADKRWLYVPTQ